MKIAFGGMTAEELFFGESGTGPGGDLAHATRIAAQMVGSFGMAGSLVSFEAVEAGPITQGIVGKVLANEDARASVERLLDQAKADVHTLLDNNRHLVIALRDELLEREELVGDEIIDVLHEAEKRHRLDRDAERVAHQVTAGENLTAAVRRPLVASPPGCRAAMPPSWPRESARAPRLRTPARDSWTTHARDARPAGGSCARPSARTAR